MTALKISDTQPVQARTILTPIGGFIEGYTHSLNPYMGCAFGEGGCGVYCYVAESPIGLYTPQPWGTWLRAKRNAAQVLRRELNQTPDRRNVRVFMSSATDPYQPAERHEGITRAVLEVFRELPVGLLVVQTRSPIVERDLDLLAEMPFAWLSMTVETDSDEVRRSLTPTCPSIGRRLAAMRHARDFGVHVQAAISPTMPHDIDRFAGLIEDAADRVVVDTFCGDGAGGRRTAHRPLPKRFVELGYGSWRDASSAEALYARLRNDMGADRVGWSREGFNALAAIAQADACALP